MIVNRQALATPGQPLVTLSEEAAVPTGHEIRLRVAAAGVCHTDVHLWEGYFNLGGGLKLDIRDRGIKLPHTLGHETVGVVEALGPEADGVNIGETCLVYPWIGCDNCPRCAMDEGHYCADPRFLGVFRAGGFADTLTVPDAKYLFPLGEQPPEVMAPLACSGLTTFSALKKVEPELRSGPVLVIGAGGLGLMALSLIGKMGGQGAYIVEPNPERAEAALASGAIEVLSPDLPLTEMLDRIGQQTAVLDLVGTDETARLGLDLLGKGGALVLVGMFGGELKVSVPATVLGGRRIIGSYVGSIADMQQLMDLVRDGGLPGVPVTTRPMEEAQSALSELRAGHGVGRTVLVPR